MNNSSSGAVTYGVTCVGGDGGRSLDEDAAMSNGQFVMIPPLPFGDGVEGLANSPKNFPHQQPSSEQMERDQNWRVGGVAGKKVTGCAYCAAATSFYTTTTDCLSLLCRSNSCVVCCGRPKCESSRQFSSRGSADDAHSGPFSRTSPGT